MSVSMYQASVPVLVRVLSNFITVLEKAKAYADFGAARVLDEFRDGFAHRAPAGWGRRIRRRLIAGHVCGRAEHRHRFVDEDVDVDDQRFTVARLGGASLVGVERGAAL